MALPHEGNGGSVTSTVQERIIGELEKLSDQAKCDLVVAADYTNCGTAYAMVGTRTVATFSYAVHGGQVNITFNGAGPGVTWSNYQVYDDAARGRHGSDGLWRDRHSFQVNDQRGYQAMLRRWRELLSSPAVPLYDVEEES